ncbi:hypothetical protein V490_06092 [Pseudogymnoascus sp. VKM F-3557]|nr:hypothetical protein V490_06092 [Pseudogymnoascus sp. VKM F-3557]
MVPRPLTWRIQTIPAGFTEEALKLCFYVADRDYIEIKSLVPDVSNYDGEGTLTATILFSPPERREPRAEAIYDFDIDKDFIGFTPLNNPDKDVCADIIAVTGLAGHAFGSWAHSRQKMWLRDYLPRDIQNRARILIYGYESQLYGAHAAKSIISDYGSSFIQSLMDLRDHPSCRDRPLILIGHSLGALIIKQAITDLEPSIRSRLPVRTLIFFGAPHNGLEVTALETLVKARPTQTLISELKRESPTLLGLAERFRHVASDMTIHTYYESRPTNTVAEGPDGNWERLGEALVMVERSSALLNVESEKTRMKVDGDHKEIVRLRRGQGGVYPNVLRIVKEALVSASEQFAAQSAETNALITAMEQFTAQAAETKAEDYWTEQYGVNSNQTPIQYPSVAVNPTPIINNWEDDDYNLVCDSCYDQFPKTQLHQHCYICSNGNYNICQACNAKGRSCPRGHDTVSRQLKEDEKEDQGETESGDPKPIAWYCDLCCVPFPDNNLRLHCNTCNNGDFDVCLACRKLGRVCVKGHKLVKLENQNTEVSPDEANTSTTTIAVTETEESGQGGVTSPGESGQGYATSLGWSIAVTETEKSGQGGVTSPEESGQGDATSPGESGQGDAASPGESGQGRTTYPGSDTYSVKSRKHKKKALSTFMRSLS